MDLMKKIVELKDIERKEYQKATNDRDRNYAHGALLAYKKIGQILENACASETSEREQANEILGCVIEMYILIRIGTNDKRWTERVSRTKKALEDYIKQKGFYWSKKIGRYIDDKTTGISGGSGTDYVIEQVDKI